MVKVWCALLHSPHGDQSVSLKLINKGQRKLKSDQITQMPIRFHNCKDTIYLDLFWTEVQLLVAGKKLDHETTVLSYICSGCLKTKVLTNISIICLCHKWGFRTASSAPSEGTLTKVLTGSHSDSISQHPTHLGLIAHTPANHYTLSI